MGDNCCFKWIDKGAFYYPKKLNNNKIIAIDDKICVANGGTKMMCKDIDEVRINIDRIDKEIVKLIAERSAFVKEAALFKKSHSSVRDPKRVEAVISKVRNLADEFGVSSKLVEKVYRKESKSN